MARRPASATGSRSFSQLLRHPSLLVRPPTREQSLADLAAVRAGEPRVVSCVLVGDAAPWPRRPRHGVLALSHERATWRPFWGRRTAHAIDLPAPEVAVREPGTPGRWPVDPRFRTLVVPVGGATLELDVPAADLPLVLGVLTPTGGA